MKKRLSPKAQALKDIREAGLSFNTHLDRNIRKSNGKYQGTYNYTYKQLMLTDV